MARPTSQALKRVHRHQPLDALAVLKILAQQTLATGLQGRGHDQRIAEAEAPALAHLQRALVERRRGQHLHQRQQHRIQVAAGSGFVQRDLCLAQEGVQAFLHHLEADAGRAPTQRLDLADASVYLIETGYTGPLVDIGTGEDVTIRKLAETVMTVVGFTGKIVFDSSKPDGTARKLTANARISALGWHPRISLRAGISQNYKNYVA